MTTLADEDVGDAEKRQKMRDLLFPLSSRVFVNPRSGCSESRIETAHSKFRVYNTTSKFAISSLSRWPIVFFRSTRLSSSSSLCCPVQTLENTVQKQKMVDSGTPLPSIYISIDCRICVPYVSYLYPLPHLAGASSKRKHSELWGRRPLCGVLRSLSFSIAASLACLRVRIDFPFSVDVCFSPAIKTCDFEGQRNCRIFFHPK